MSLVAANGCPLTVYGESVVKLESKELRKTFQWTFVVADVSQPIIGADFFRHFNLLIDCGSEN